ncbi:MAG: hypothetical protein AB8C13_05040 [Phycisphaerales bacterium]
MHGSSLFIVLIYASVSAVAGVILLRIGIQGKRVSTSPHCRSCKFDLGGLDLSNPTNCPECGGGVSDSSKTVRDGLYKKRPWIILLAMMFLLVSVTGFAWPKLSKLPSIQSVDVYDYFPESLLVRLATTGDENALQTIHDRLIPNKVSDKALQSLIDHTFKLRADLSIPWDERWGDVLLYGMHSNLLEDSEIQQIAESSFTHELIAHSVIGPDADLQKIILSTLDTRGQGTRQFKRELFTRSTPWSGYIKVYPILTDDSKVNRDGYMGSGIQDWVPYRNGGAFGRVIDIPLDTEEFTIRVPIRYELLLEDQVIHHWEVMLSHTVNRSETTPEYITVNQDQALETNLIKSMTMGKLSVPTDVRNMAKHESVRIRTFAFAYIEHLQIQDIALIGWIHYRLGNKEVRGREIVVDLGKHNRIGLWPKYDDGSQGWLKSYIKQEEFWGKVIEAGSVDVIYRPDPSLAQHHPGFKGLVNTPIVFESVEVKPLQTQQIQSSRKPSNLEWIYDHSFDLERKYHNARRLKD